MGRRLYIGNLPYSVTEEEVRQAFEAVGQVESVTIVTDRETGRPRGFGFVELASDDLAQTAISEMNGKPLGERNIVVNEARPMERQGGGGGGGRGGGGDRGGRGGGGGDRGGRGGPRW